jgi:hypothetical protein
MSSAMRNFMEAYHAVHNPDAKEEFYSKKDELSEMDFSLINQDELDEIAEEALEEMFSEGFTVSEAELVFEDIITEAKVSYGHDTESPRAQKVKAMKSSLKGAIDKVKGKASKGAVKGYQAYRDAKTSAADKARRTAQTAKNMGAQTARKASDAKAKIKSGLKGMIGKAAERVASGASNVAKRMSEGVRDMDPEKGTKERKARLEKKRGMKMDDHPQYKKEEVEQVDEMIDPKGAARMDAAKKKKKVDVFAYDRKLQAQGKLKGKKLPPPPTNEAAQYDEMYKALPKEKMQRQTQKAYDKEQRAVAAGDEKEVNKQMQRRIAMTSPSGRKSALMKKSMKEAWADAYRAIYEVDEEAKPDYLDFDKDGNKKESMKKALKDKKKGNPKHGMKGHKSDDDYDHDENGGDMSEAKDFIQKAIKRPGAFTAKAKERGMSAKEFASKVTANSKDYDERTVKQANLAKTLSGLKKEEQDFDAILQEVQKDGTPIEEALWIIANTTI